jgi:hypothetical protein
MRKCGCGREVAYNASNCPNCGRRFTHPLTWFFLATVGLCIFLFIIQPPAPSPSTKTAPAARAAVSADFDTKELWKKGGAKWMNRALRLSDQHPGWSLDACELVAQKKIRVGITDEQALASWGRPTKINRTVMNMSVDEQWVYENADAYLYFTDGILKSYQTAR